MSQKFPHINNVRTQLFRNIFSGIRVLLHLSVLSLGYSQFSFEISTDTSIYLANQTINLSLRLFNDNQDTICLTLPNSHPIELNIDGNSFTLGNWTAQEVVELTQNEYYEWNYSHNNNLDPGKHYLFGVVHFYFPCEESELDTLIFIESNLVRFVIVDNLNVTLGNKLSQLVELENYPNPFNPVTIIKYELPQRSAVRVIIYDLLGRKVKTLVSETQDAGFKTVTWNATNDRGKPVSAGVYLYQIQAGDYVQTRKMVLLK